VRENYYYLLQHHYNLLLPQTTIINNPIEGQLVRLNKLGLAQGCWRTTEVIPKRSVTDGLLPSAVQMHGRLEAPCGYRHDEDNDDDNDDNDDDDDDD